MSLHFWLSCLHLSSPRFTGMQQHTPCICDTEDWTRGSVPSTEAFHRLSHILLASHMQLLGSPQHGAVRAKHCKDQCGKAVVAAVSRTSAHEQHKHIWRAFCTCSQSFSDLRKLERSRPRAWRDWSVSYKDWKDIFLEGELALSKYFENHKEKLSWVTKKNARR